jgi:hypothetical protein
MPAEEIAIRDFRSVLMVALEKNLADAFANYRCEYEYSESTHGQSQHPICWSRDAVVMCCDCGRKLCRDHKLDCCGETWCEFCLEAHQIDPEHVPYEELVS